MNEHLNALELRLSHERERLNAATRPEEIAIRKVWVEQAEREVAREKLALGIADAAIEISDDDLMRELGA